MFTKKKLKYHVDFDGRNPLEVFYDKNDKITRVLDYTVSPPRKGYDFSVGFEISKEAFDELVIRWEGIKEGIALERKKETAGLSKDEESKLKKIDEAYYNWHPKALIRDLEGKATYWSDGERGRVYKYSLKHRKMMFFEEVDPEDVYVTTFDENNWSEVSKAEYDEILAQQRKREGILFCKWGHDPFIYNNFKIE